MTIEPDTTLRPLACDAGSAIAPPLMSLAMPDSVARLSVLDFQGEMSVTARNRLAVQDVIDGLRLRPLAWSLGWLDIRLRYRGSILGPFWLTLSTAIMVSALGVLYSALFHTDVHQYLPFLTLSQILWFFISTVVSDACTCFTQAEGMIRSIRMPLFLHAMRTLIRNVLILAHNVVVIVAVFAIFSIWPGWHALLALPALVLWIIDAFAICLLLGTFCARFRDIGPIVASIMQIAFFLTPVIWQPQQLGVHAVYLPLNPFFALIEIVRAPLLGTTPSAVTWLAALGYSLLLCALSWTMFVRARGRIAFWI
jgi:lipopolysaccharide transport system permease protein